MSRIQKIPTSVATPLNKNNNLYYYDVPNQYGQIDHSSSYQELEVVLYKPDGTQESDLRNVVFGQDGLAYNASALFRSSSLMESRSKKKYQDLTFVNVLSNNLEYWTKGVNNLKADALWSGQGALSNDGSVLSVFNNSYSDTNPVVRIGMDVLYPGDLGVTQSFPQEDDLEYRYTLEPQYPVFMRAVDSELYNHSSYTLEALVPFANATANAQVISASSTGIVIGNNYAVGDYIKISYNDATTGDSETAIRKITVVTEDDAQTPGSLTFVGALSTNDIEAVTVQKITFIQTALSCTETSTTVLTFVNPYNLEADIYKNTNIEISYLDPATEEVSTMLNKIASLTLNGTNNKIVSVALQTALPSASLINVSIVPLYTNMNDYNWSVLSANLVLYREAMPSVAPQNFLMTTFSSQSVQCTAGVDKFSYTFKAPVNAFNTYLMMIGSSNLYSQVDEYDNYKYTVNEEDLTMIYVPLNDSVIHKDNLIRTLSNSLVYSPKNLKDHKDINQISVYNPQLFPAKIFHSQVKGMENYQNEMMPDNDVKVECFCKNGEVTTPKTVYLFCEKYVKI